MIMDRLFGRKDDGSKKDNGSEKDNSETLRRKDLSQQYINQWLAKFEKTLDTDTFFSDMDYRPSQNHKDEMTRIREGLDTLRTMLEEGLQNPQSLVVSSRREEANQYIDRKALRQLEGADKLPFTNSFISVNMAKTGEAGYIPPGIVRDNLGISANEMINYSYPDHESVTLNLEIELRNQLAAIDSYMERLKAKGATYAQQRRAWHDSMIHKIQSIPLERVSINHQKTKYDQGYVVDRTAGITLVRFVNRVEVRALTYPGGTAFHKVIDTIYSEGNGNESRDLFDLFTQQAIDPLLEDKKNR